MNTTLPRKGLDLMAAFLREPATIPAYLRSLPRWGRHPTDLELPWFSFGAIRHLEGWLRPTHQVFEFGCGGSSLFFSRRTRSVTAVEHDPVWHDRLAELAADRGRTNIHLELHPLPADLTQFREQTFFQPVLDRKWDVIVVDCYCGFEMGNNGPLRPHALSLAFGQLNPGGLIVLDDSWMYPKLLAAPTGWKVSDYIGLGPCRYGVTSTAIYQKI